MTLGCRLNVEQDQGKSSRRRIRRVDEPSVYSFPEQWSSPLTSVYEKKQKGFGVCLSSWAWIWVCVCSL